MKTKKNKQKPRNNLVVPMFLHTKAWTKKRRKEKGGARNRQLEWQD